MSYGTYKIWRSLTEPLIYHGITFDYVIALCLFSMGTFVFSFNSVIATLTVFLVGLILGIVLSRKDKRWFSILIVNLRHFGVNIFRRVKYVR